LRHGWVVALALGCGVPDEAAPGERPKPPIQPGPLGLRVECEQLDGSWARQTNLPGFSGTGFAVSNEVGAPAESQISGKIEVLEPGRYRVWARGFEGGGADRSWQLRIGEIELPPTHIGVDAESFSWQLAGS